MPTLPPLVIFNAVPNTVVFVVVDNDTAFTSVELAVNAVPIANVLVLTTVVPTYTAVEK